ncbi:DUF5403 family protein [Leucobacter allii]|uniref:DUF5403 family protein n=1 Tax=Leucobacter allii TaxID=2932247 RepID=UPI001FD2B82C|nr:DUF5403 family protein [Leucobacter allii]UOR02063.1 DUF5403 family protein [Leucobacter allii]
MGRLNLANDLQLRSAVICGDSPIMDAVSSRLRTNIMAEAAQHNLTTAFMNSIEEATVPGESGNGLQVNDRVVYSTDPGALAINYGHFARQAEGSDTIPDFVPGKHVFEAGMGRTAR